MMDVRTSPPSARPSISVPGPSENDVDPDQAPVLANLLELYAHDLSEYFDVPLQPSGRFGYPFSFPEAANPGTNGAAATAKMPSV